jgi:tetratricopeptide (TPR) repeat protein
VAAAALLAVATAGAGGATLAALPSAAVRFENSGEQHFQAGRFTEAVSSFTRSLDENPDQPIVYFKRGRALQQLGLADTKNYQRAYDDYNRANPAENGRILACIGYCQSRRGSHRSAIEWYSRAIKAGFATPEVYNNLAYSQLRICNYVEADFSATLALAGNGNLLSARLLRAQSHCNRAGSSTLDYDPGPALDDMQTVIAQNGTADECFLAMKICALSLQVRKYPPDDPFDAHGERYAKLAVSMGWQAHQNENALLKRWAANVMAKSPPAEIRAQPAKLDLLVDPLRGLTE